MTQENHAAVDADLATLDRAKHAWAQTPIPDRITLLEQIKDALAPIAQDWARAAAQAKGLDPDGPLAGEEWLSGPYAVMSTCNNLMATLRRAQNGTLTLPQRTLAHGQQAVKVLPYTLWDRLLLSGVTADVWMDPAVTAQDVPHQIAAPLKAERATRQGKVALVLGAGNIAAIPPLDVFQKLFAEDEVVILKMNPVNAYLAPFLEAALKPLIDVDALRIVRGGGDLGAWLCDHPLVETLHITGAGATHDAIVWGTGPEGAANKAAGTPKNPRPMTSELGAVCPTIVVPGPWSDADIAFQAENIATQKLHNSGFNCIACQVLVVPDGWDKTDPLVTAITKTIAQNQRPAYYPGAQDRCTEFEMAAETATPINRGDAPDCILAPTTPPALTRAEVFAPALSLHRMAHSDAEGFLKAAIAWANDTLYGTLGGNIIIHPATIRAMGRDRFDALLADFKYGCIAVNTWAGVGFLLTVTPWGAFPGHRLDDVQSGIGQVHNTFMIAQAERAVIEAPFRPFPRGILSGDFSLLPRPPWFITNKRAHALGRLLTAFQHRPSWLKIPKIFWEALRG